MWALGASNDVLDKTEVLLWLSFLLVPISIAGAYWLALFRLRSVKALRTWLVIPILLGVGSYALQTLQLLNQSTAFGPGSFGGPWDIIMLAGEALGLILFAI